MSRLECRPFAAERMEEVKEIYKEAGWLAYLKDDEALNRAFEQSLYVYGAFDKEKLVGFVRCVGDGEHIVVVQDLIVAEQYRRQGIGALLMDHIMEKYRHVRMLALFTDAQDERANRFYQKMKLHRIEEMSCVSYMR